MTWTCLHLRLQCRLQCWLACSKRSCTKFRTLRCRPCLSPICYLPHKTCAGRRLRMSMELRHKVVYGSHLCWPVGRQLLTRVSCFSSDEYFIAVQPILIKVTSSCRYRAASWRVQLHIRGPGRPGLPPCPVADIQQSGHRANPGRQERPCPLHRCPEVHVPGAEQRHCHMRAVRRDVCGGGTGGCARLHEAAEGLPCRQTAFCQDTLHQAKEYFLKLLRDQVSQRRCAGGRPAAQAECGGPPSGACAQGGWDSLPGARYRMRASVLFQLLLLHCCSAGQRRPGQLRRRQRRPGSLGRQRCP